MFMRIFLFVLVLCNYVDARENDTCFNSGGESPISNTQTTAIRKGFGEFDAPRKGKSSGHQGVDIISIGNYTNTKSYEVKAWRSGKIAYARLNGSDTEGFGNTIVINHLDGTYSQYSHLAMNAAKSSTANLMVKLGECVVAGQIIGHMSQIRAGQKEPATGNASRIAAEYRTQVHFSVIKRNNTDWQSSGKIGSLWKDKGSQILNPTSDLLALGYKLSGF